MNKVLIIDDDIDMQSLLAKIISSAGYETIVADDGNRALREIRAHSPDLTLLDIRLPGMNGMQVLKEIKKMDRNLIVIMLTGYGDIKDAVQAIKLGAFNYITKPFENIEIVANIKNALLTRRLTSKRHIASLSPREREVLNWLKRGKTSWDISVILNVTERTINFHIDNIMKKLNAVSRTQAVTIAIEAELISSE